MQEQTTETRPNARKNHGDAPSSFTVWNKLSMSFLGTDGFTMFNQMGGLVCRVDNYSRNKISSDGISIVLMDDVGNVLLTLRPRGFSLRCQWNAYRVGWGGEYRVFAMKRRTRSLLVRNTKSEPVYIFLRGSPRSNPSPDFMMEGSFARRNCIIRRKADGAPVAKIAHKRARSSPIAVLGDDVFSLVLQPGFDPVIVMGFVLMLDL